MKILFVCTGNTCRSPMAEGVAKAVFERDGISAEVESRGISVFSPMPVSENAIRAMEKYGIYISGNKSKQISETDIENFDLVLTMTKQHKQILSKAAANEKIYTVSRYAFGIDTDICDPYGLGLDEYIKCADQIFSCIEAISKKIRDNK